VYTVYINPDVPAIDPEGPYCEKGYADSLDDFPCANNVTIADWTPFTFVEDPEETQQDPDDDETYSAGRDMYTGWGLIDADKAVAKAQLPRFAVTGGTLPEALSHRKTSSRLTRPVILRSMAG